MAREAKATSSLGHIALYHAERELLLNQPEQAERWLEQARSYFDPSDLASQEATDLLASEVYIRRHELDRARQLSNRLLQHMGWDNPDRSRVHLLAAQIALAKKVTRPGPRRRPT